MNEIISSELTKEVLGISPRVVQLDSNNEVYLEWDGGQMINFKYVNIYELAHKCKEWADKKSYRIKCTTYFHEKMKKQVSLSEVEKRIQGEFFSEFSTQSDIPEYESIFKACQWILEKEGN